MEAMNNFKFAITKKSEMNDTPIEFTDIFSTIPDSYSFSSVGYAVSDGKLALMGDITVTRAIEPTRSGNFGLAFSANRLEGMEIALYQDTVEAVALKLEEDGTILCSRVDDWVEISDPGKLEAGKSVELSLDLAPDRNSNYFTVRVNGVITGTALYNNTFSYIDKIAVSVPIGSAASIESLFVLKSHGVIQIPERKESSPKIYLPLVIDGAKPMYITDEASPVESALNYVSETDRLVLDVNGTAIGVDLGSVQPVNAIRITGKELIARPLSHNNYSVYQSDDNRNWVKVKGFSMNHFTENGVSVALFEVTGVETRYLKVRCNATADKFEIAHIRAEMRIARQWKMAGYAMYAINDTTPVCTPMMRELYDKAITVKKDDSIGINFGINSHAQAIELVGDGLSSLEASAFELYRSCDNQKYTLVENTVLSYDEREGKQVYRLGFDDTVCGYLKLHAVKDMTVKLDDLYDGLCAYSSVEVESGYSDGSWNVNPRGGEGDYYTMPDGTLVMIYTGYPESGAHGDDDDNMLKAIQSTDGGYTWGDSWVTLKKQEGNVNLMCSSCHYMANGDLAILYIEKFPGEIAHVLIRRSQDYGRSWDEPVCITEEPLGYSILSSAVNGLHLSNGRFVVAINYSYTSKECYGSDRSVSYIACSDDDGYTWKKSATSVTLPNAALEPVVAELADGNLIMTMRTRRENSIYQTISTDNGITWAQPVRVENMNTPSSTNNVHTHPSTGDLMLVWNDEIYDSHSRVGGNGNRDPLCVAISTDNGLTYKNQRNLVDGRATWACIRFYGRAMLLQCSNQLKVIDIAEMYYTREGGKTVADLPRAATPTATYADGWLAGVSNTIQYSLDGGMTWKFCGGTSVQIGDVASLMVKDIGTHETAPSDIQTVK